MNIIELIKIARDAQNKSYSPYSNFRVGCALLMKDGKVISGANIENASYSLTICAERSTLFTAHNLGYKKDDIECMVLCGDCDDFITPCGSCRQVISELYPHKAPIYLLNKNNDVKETTIGELLPLAFKESDLK